MRKLKWLYPGMRVKRWVVVLLLGVFAIVTGAVVMLNTPLFSLWEQRILAWAAEWPVNPAICGAALIVLGLAGVSIGMRNVVNSVVEAIRPADVPDLVEHVYKARNLQKGLRIVAIGGGTGLSTMLRGLKEYTSNITAVVTVADDGAARAGSGMIWGFCPLVTSATPWWPLPTRSPSWRLCFSTAFPGERV